MQHSLRPLTASFHAIPHSRAQLLLVALGVTLGVLGCTSTQDSLGDSTGSTCPADSTLTYENFGQAFIATNCASCHQSQESPRLASQADVQASIDLIDRAAASGPGATNTYMPEDGTVATADRAKLGQWLACGAP